MVWEEGQYRTPKISKRTETTIPNKHHPLYLFKYANIDSISGANMETKTGYTYVHVYPTLHTDAFMCVHVYIFTYVHFYTYTQNIHKYVYIYIYIF